MSVVNAMPDVMCSAATDLANIGAAIRGANEAAAAPTAALFGRNGLDGGQAP